MRVSDRERETDQEEHDRQEAERQELRDEHLRRTNRKEGAPERISSAEDTQRQFDES